MNDNAMNSQHECIDANRVKIGAASEQETKAVKAYESPELICYGDVRDVTLGPTVGTGESGCEVLAVGPPTLPCPF